ncbi:YbjN domain-containing protein [Alteromonas sp. C1M14]|nr:YbjN domain-containing protein [Alteromonas sp. C1M14]
MVAASCVQMLSLAPEAHAADLITAEDPYEILNIAKGFGSANLKKDSSGDPMITGRIDGNKYGIFFYGCSDGRNCDEIQFVAAWSGVDASLSDVNEYNRLRKFGKAYLDSDGDPNLDMIINMDYGITVETLEDNFDWWTKIIKTFETEVLKI